ncbi:MAG: DUF3300 domain-containing protein [Candidatus Sulfotelmatobacter sp.]
MHPVLRGPTALLLTAIFSVTSLTTGCKSSQDANQTPSPAAPPNEQAQPQSASLSLDDLVAPIALYPDQLLAQVLTASTSPQEVLDGGNWIIQNQNLKGDALTSAAKTAGFGPSMQYLMNFPQVVDNMCQEMDWTTQLGQAFQSDQKGVMEAVQRKRGQAQQAGNLVSSPQMTVATKTDNGQQYVEIAPADPKVVYVPQYNPVTIYNTQAAPAPAQTTTVVTQTSGVSTGTAVGIGLLSFGVGMAIGAAISNNNNYYPYPAWGYHGVYYGGRPYYPPPYRPVYPGYHPANGYRPPPNYHWSQVNNNVNIKVNNNNYYNKFNNQNRPSTLPANNRPMGTPSTMPATNRSGQGANTYQGARPTTGSQKPGSSMANAIPSNQQLGNRSNPSNQMRGGSTPNAVPRNQQVGTPGNQAGNMNRPNAGNSPTAGNRAGNAGAGNMANTRPSPANAGSMNRGGASPTPQPANRGGDRGYGNTARPATGTANAPAPRSSPSPQTQNRGSGGGAFSGNSAKTERADSSRGRASAGAPAKTAPNGGGRKTR